jgi:dTDP-4-dehydrorhamnose 3,5-epimerase
MVSLEQVSRLPLKVTTTPLSGVLILEPKVFGDARGFFFESYNENAMHDAGIRERFVQDNHSYSAKNVIRGLHYQIRPHAQGKLVRVAVGEVFDVAVDLRRSSPTFGKWYGVRLSGENFKMLWIPPGFAHGFQALSDGAHVLYKATDFYHPECERTLAWNDPEVGIDWPLDGEPVVSAKDRQGSSFQDAEKFE